MASRNSGLGIIRKSGDGRVEIAFPAAGETRIYAIDTAPLRRVRFLPGDRIKDPRGRGDDGRAGARGARLADLLKPTTARCPKPICPTPISFSKPEERLFGGKLDDHGDFDLRGEALRRRADMRRSPVRGLAGARMDLIPHQLFIADEVANRPRPRVLLADQVGLGKTIEACLILHRLILTGRAERVLILVPEPLVHQWFVELLRRFQLSFSLYRRGALRGDRVWRSRVQSVSRQPVGARRRGFSGRQRARAPRRRSRPVGMCWWWMRRITWNGRRKPPDRRTRWFAALAETTEGLLLLTATPQQLGPEGHFARLQLLDPGPLRRSRALSRGNAALRGSRRCGGIAGGRRRGGRAGLRAFVAGRHRLEQRVADLIAEKPGRPRAADFRSARWLRRRPGDVPQHAGQARRLPAARAADRRWRDATR